MSDPKSIFSAELSAGQIIVKGMVKKSDRKQIKEDPFDDVITPDDFWANSTQLRCLLTEAPELVSKSEETLVAGTRISLGGTLVFLEKTEHCPSDKYAIQVDELTWIKPGSTQKLLLENGNYVLSKIGGFYAAHRSFKTDEMKNNCRIEYDAENFTVDVVITKDVAFDDVFRFGVYDVNNVQLVDQQKLEWLKRMIAILYEFQFEIDGTSGLSDQQDCINTYLDEVVRFSDVVAYLSTVSTVANCIRTVLIPCIAVMNTPEESFACLMYPGSVPNKYDDVVFPINHLLFSAVRQPFVFCPGYTWEDKPKMLYRDLYVKRHQQLKSVSKFFIPALGEVDGIMGVDGEYLFGK